MLEEKKEINRREQLINQFTSTTLKSMFYLIWRAIDILNARLEDIENDKRTKKKKF